MIEVLWELSHREELSRELVDKALDEMYHIMVDSTVMKDSYKKKYLERCIDSIKKGKVASLYAYRLEHHGLGDVQLESENKLSFGISFGKDLRVTVYTWS